MEASLVTRLAGPSNFKAGLSKDQTEINRIIAEASVGSKFYENEKRKDKELTEKITKLLKFRDESMRGVDIPRLEANIDKMLVKLEEQRDLTQCIVHVDMDAFFAAVEMLDKPSLKGKPFGVGRGVLTTASYEARLYGVRSGMAADEGFIAKKLCPQLILVPIRGERYSEMSGKVMAVFRTYDANMMAAGADEAYLNITRYCQGNGVSPDECIQRLRAQVHAETSLTVSAGIAPNMMLAKICSDKNKPNGQFHLPFERNAIMDFVRDLPIRKIPGFGRVSERLLDSIGVKTCGDIHKFRVTLSVLDQQFHLRSLLLVHLGIASNVVQPGQRQARKSVGSERTFDPISDERAIISKLKMIATELEDDMERTGWAGKTVTLKYKLDTYQVFSRAKSSTRYINRKEDLLEIGKELLIPELPLKIRLIGLRVTKLKDIRAPEGPGLKRFFEAVESSPTKKRQKLDHVAQDDAEGWGSENEEEILSEHDDNSVMLVGEELAGGGGALVSDSSSSTATPRSRKLDAQQETACLKPKSSSAKPMSIAGQSTKQEHFTAKLSSTSTKPISQATAMAHKSKAARPLVEELMCPICSKMFEMDNAGLNEHIDYCLSKGAILAATATPNKHKSPTGKERDRLAER